MLATRSCLPQKPFTEAQGFPEAGGQTSPALRWAHDDRAQGHCASNLLWREACQADEKGGQPQAPQDGLISKVNRVCPRIFDLVFLPLPRNPSFSDLSQDGICGVSLEEAVKKLQDAGYLSNPSRCPACGRGCLGDLFRYGKNEDLVGRKCTQWDCRARFNALNLNQALPDQLGRSFRADQLYAAIKMYTDSGVSRHALHGLHCLFCKHGFRSNSVYEPHLACDRPPTPAEAAKTLGLSSKGPRRLFAALLEKVGCIRLRLPLQGFRFRICPFRVRVHAT